MKRAALAVLMFAACASPSAPPGGPPDTDAPKLVRVTPDSGRVNVKPKDVIFEFDEVVSETPKGGSDLRHLVLISPSDGLPDVDWRRKSIAVRPHRGWKANTTYVITLLPGILDLRNNARDSSTVVVFSTGDKIPQTRVSGTVFDWNKAAFAPHAYIVAWMPSDTVLKFTTEADSVGRFVLPFLTPAEYQVRALIDGNKNRTIDPREAWDSAAVTLADTASFEFYAFVHDTIGPRLTGATVEDSVTVHLTFDQPLKPGTTPVVQIFRPDSTPVNAASVVPWAQLAERRTRLAKARTDSIAAADTSASARAARDRILVDSINRAAAIADSVARDTVKRVPPPVAKRPALSTEVGVQFSAPLLIGLKYRVTVQPTGMLGAGRPQTRTFERPKPAPPPPAVRRPDTTDVKSQTTRQRRRL